MKNVNPDTKRIVGGNSFTDSIIRTNANTEEYVRYILSLVSKNLFRNEKLLEYVCDLLRVVVTCESREIFSIKEKDIETFRQVEVLAFDRFVLEMIRFGGYSIYEDSEYYKRIRY